MAPNCGWTAAVLVIAAAAIAMAAMPADADSGLEFDAEFIDMSGDIYLTIELQQEFEFSEELFGGSVPKQYVPAVEKGLLECMEKGPLAGCKCQNIKAVLYDGSYRDV